MTNKPTFDPADNGAFADGACNANTLELAQAIVDASGLLHGGE